MRGSDRVRQTSERADFGETGSAPAAEARALISPKSWPGSVSEGRDRHPQSYLIDPTSASIIARSVR